MLIVDSHCHLDMLQNKDSSEMDQKSRLDEIIQRAKEMNVAYMQTICTRLDNFENILKIARNYDNVFASVGIHPSEVVDKNIISSGKLSKKEEEQEHCVGDGQGVIEVYQDTLRSSQIDSLSSEGRFSRKSVSGEIPIVGESNNIATSKRLIELGSDEKVIGFGETGLDYFYHNDEAHRLLQRESFEHHIEASQYSEMSMPIIIHTRDAEEDTTAIINRNMKFKAFPVLIHCFTGSEVLARAIINLGGYISVSGIVTFKNATELQKIVKFLPLDRILVETDSPYLAPIPHRGKTNEPSFTKHIVEFIADLKGVSAEVVASMTTDNFFNLFSKAKRSMIQPE